MIRMEKVQPSSSFTSDTSLSGQHPRTPPYTPYGGAKRRIERSDSPVSISSTHPAETESPAKKAMKRLETDDVRVEELVEGDVGYISDGDVVHPAELEEVSSSDEDAESTDSDGDESDTGISRLFSHLGCEVDEEAEFEKKRREKHLRKRTGSRVYKRPHSESAKNDIPATADPDAMHDHDFEGSARRLRRRVYGPQGVRVVYDDHVQPSPSKSRGLAAAAEIHERRRNPILSDDGSPLENNAGGAMDVDDEE